jgi:SAM-dependent methyltransferase
MTDEGRPLKQDSTSASYAAYLKSADAPLWRRLLDVQLPYRWNLRRLQPGFTLDVGCGVGRNLRHLNGHGVGVDPNLACVAEARLAGFEAYTPEDFAIQADLQDVKFDSLLVSHVLEHLPFDAGVDLVRRYLPYVKPAGKIILITPQERGFQSDPTHVEFMDLAKLRRLATSLDLKVARAYSFPFPRFAGPFFPYNEFLLVATYPR